MSGLKVAFRKSRGPILWLKVPGCKINIAVAGLKLKVGEIIVAIDGLKLKVGKIIVAVRPFNNAVDTILRI